VLLSLKKYHQWRCFVDLLIGILGGGLCSWLITHVYYRQANQDQNAVFNKLSLEVRNAILDDTRTSLSIKDLNELIRERTIDSTSSDKYPYLACPRCGSEDIERGQDAIVDGEWDDGAGLLVHYPYDFVKCRTCDWSKSDLDHDSD
jgi:hypothetical protein